MVVEEMAGRLFLVTTKIKGQVRQQQFTLHSALSDSEIKKLVQAGVPITCFEPNPAVSKGQGKKAMKELNRFVVQVSQHQSRMSPTVRTKLVESGTPRPAATDAPDPVVVPDTEVAGLIELKLIKAGVDFETAAAASIASLDELKEMDYKAIGKLLGLRGNFGLQRVYDEMRA